MKWVKWSHWTDAGMVEFGEGPLNKLEESIREFERQAKKALDETGADHVVYAVKEYDEEGSLTEIRFYTKPMSDGEFERVAQMTGCRIYALHKR